MSRIKKLVFILLLLLLLVDRVITLSNFGFIYADLDQILLWEGALDYAEGIFREPYFYGQNYNFMLESFLAVPLLYFNIPVYIALPTVTSILAVLPIVVLSFFLIKNEEFVLACVCLGFPLLLPLEYNVLTTIPRGFLQASLFLPMVFFAVFRPLKDCSVILFYIGSGLCFLANPSSIIVFVPIGVYLLTFHYKSLKFYLRALFVVPFLILLWFAKHYYTLRPEKTLVELEGIDLQIKTLLEMIQRSNLFEFLFPFVSGWGFLYWILILILLIWTWMKRPKKDFLFLFAGLVILLISISIPKVLGEYANAGAFFTTSRLFLHLPVLFLLMLFIAFSRREHNTKTRSASPILLFGIVGIALLGFSFKNYNFKERIEKKIELSSFPVGKVADIIPRVQYIDSIAKKYNADVMVTRATMGWKFAFDGFSYSSICQTVQKETPKMISIFNVNERRSWLIKKAERSERILLYVCFINEENLVGLDHESVGYGLHLIKNNTLPLSELFKKLELEYGIPKR